MRSRSTSDSALSSGPSQKNGRLILAGSEAVPGKAVSVSEPRSLPFSEDAEKGVLCSLLLSPKEVNDACALSLVPEAFYIPAHRIIYDLIIELCDKNKPVDFVLLRQALTDRDQLDEIGGVEYLSDLYAFIPTAANAEFYIEIVREKYLLRRLILACNKLSWQAYENQDEISSLLDEAEREVFAISQGLVSDEVQSFRSQLLAVWESLEHAFDNRGRPTGLTTGFKDLDRMLGGLQRTDMIVIAARPSLGKTSLAMNIAEHVAMDLGKPTAVFSLEMSSEQLVQRILASRAKVESSRLKNGLVSQRDIQELTRTMGEISEAPLYIDDTPGLVIMELRAKARRLKAQHDIQLAVIDYLQLLRSPSKKSSDNRQLEIAEISAGIKGLAKELNIPILVAAQLNRQPEQRDGGRPRLSDLRESGSIEQDADVVGLLARPEFYAKNDEEKEEHEGEAELIIAKHRNGPTGEIPLTFLKRFVRFESAIREDRAPQGRSVYVE